MNKKFENPNARLQKSLYQLGAIPLIILIYICIVSFFKNDVKIDLLEISGYFGIASFVFFAFGYVIGREKRKYSEKIDKAENQKCAFVWKYSEQEWNQYIEDEKRRTQKNIFFYMVNIVVVTVVTIVWHSLVNGFDYEFAILITVAMASMAGLIYFMAIKSIKILSNGENRTIMIDKDFIVIGDVIFELNSIGSNLVKVELQETNIVLTVRIVARYGHTSREIYIPVPQGQEGKKVIKFFS